MMGLVEKMDEILGIDGSVEKTHGSAKAPEEPGTVAAGEVGELRWLTEAGLDLLSLASEREIIDYAGRTLTERLGDCVTLVLTSVEEGRALRIRGIFGLEEQLVARAVGIVGDGVLSRACSVDERFDGVYRKRRLYRHEAGLADFSSEALSRPVAQALARLLNVKDVYTLALVGEERVLGNIHILARQADLIESPESVEVFAHQVALALERAAANEALQKSESRYRGLFEHASIGFALHDVILDDRGDPVDHVFREVNPAFEEMTGLDGEEIVGRRVTEVLPSIEDDAFIDAYGRVGLTGEPARLERHVKALGRHYEITAYSPAEGQFVTLVSDVTESMMRERAERRLAERVAAGLRAGDLAWWEMALPSGEVAFDDRKAAMLGYPAERFETYRDFVALIHPEDRPRAMRAMRDHLDGEAENYEVEYRIETQSGDLKWFRDVGGIASQVDESGTTRVVGIVEDITERKTAQRALARSERKLKEIFEASPIAIELYDADGRLIEANEACLDLFGVASFADVRGFDLFSDPNLPDGARASLRQGEMVRYEMVFDFELVKDHELYETDRSGQASLDVRITPLRVSAGHPPEGYLVHAQNVTERREAERQLRASKQRLELALHGGDLATWDWNVQTDELHFNERWPEMLGYSLEEIEPRLSSWERLVHPEDFPRAWRRLEAHVRGETPSYEAEMRMRHRSGEWRWILDRGKVIEWDEEGEPLRACGTHLDITERKKMERRLREEERMAALGQMAAGVAHDFRNRLNPIILYADMALDRHDLPPSLRAQMEATLEESRGMADLVQQILDFTSRAMIERKPLDLGELTEDLVAELADEFAPDVTIEVRPNGGRYPVLADEARIRQALRNLALNARDAMPDGGELTFELTRVEVCDGEDLPLSDAVDVSSDESRAGHWVCLAVTDTGTGMRDEVRSHLFEPFFTTKDVGKGVGLGLSQVYGTVRQHEGLVDVETTVGSGTTICIYLPAHEVGGDDSGGRQPDAARGEAEGSILLIADKSAWRDGVEDRLASLGFEVVPATTVRQAAALCRSPRWSTGRSSIDLVVIDITECGKEGGALMERLKRAHPALRAIGVHDSGDGVSVEPYRELAYVDLVTQPVAPDSLTDLALRALD